MRNGMEQTRSNQNMTQGIWARIKTSNFWQAAFVRPFTDKKNWKKAVGTLLAYAFGVVFIVAPTAELIDGSLNYPVPLDRMRVDNGSVADIQINRRQGFGSFSIKKQDGEKQRFFIHHLALVKLREDEQVRVWSQKGFRLFNGVIYEAREVLIVDQQKLILEHTKNLAWLKRRYEHLKSWDVLFLILGVLLITYPWLRHRKPVSQTHHSHQA